MPTNTTFCALCQKAIEVEPIPTAILAPAMSVDGKRLEIPGTYPLCLKCRQQVAMAERAYTVSQKRDIRVV